MDAVQTAVDVAALVSPPGFREAMAGTSIAISYFRGNKIDAVAAGENGVLLAFELVKMISPAGRLANIACMGIRLTYLGFGAYRMYQGYQEGRNRYGDAPSIDRCAGVLYPPPMFRRSSGIILDASPYLFGASRYQFLESTLRPVGRPKGAREDTNGR